MLGLVVGGADAVVPVTRAIGGIIGVDGNPGHVTPAGARVVGPSAPEVRIEDAEIPLRPGLERFQQLLLFREQGG